MAFNVLVVPEDFRKDRYVLKPIVEKMMASLGVKARVEVCCDPLLGGVGEAMRWERLQEILLRYRGMIRVFLLVVDRDCKAGRRQALDELEAKAAAFFGGDGGRFLAEAAWQEVEVWVLAGLKDLPSAWAWKEVRAECDPKEKYFDAMAERRGLRDAPYEGREALAREAVESYRRIRQLCPEDVERLEDRLRQILGGTP